MKFVRACAKPKRKTPTTIKRSYNAFISLNGSHQPLVSHGSLVAFVIAKVLIKHETIALLAFYTLPVHGEHGQWPGQNR